MIAQLITAWIVYRSFKRVHADRRRERLAAKVRTFVVSVGRMKAEDTASGVEWSWTITEERPVLTGTVPVTVTWSAP